MTDRPGNDRFGILTAVLGGLLVALAAVLIIFLVAQNDDGATTTEAASTTETTAPATTTTAATTTDGATTTTTPTTTTTGATTTEPPFAGTFDDKTGPIQGSPAGRLTEIRSAAHPGYARVVFDFAPGGIPSYWVGYTDATTLTVILYPMDEGDPYDAGIFDAGGNHPVAAGNIVAVQDSGMGAGSGEWVFDIVVTAQRPFLAGTVADPPRLYVDVGD